MQKAHLEYLACPACRGDLTIAEVSAEANGRIETGSLACAACAKTYPILGHVPRFVAAENYAHNFGFQWNKYVEMQYDRCNGMTRSGDRWFDTTRWPRSLEGELVLEAGSGAGRFTDIALSTGAMVVSFDFSSAVEANYRMNGDNPRLLLAQGNIFEPPIKEGIFDRVFCMGVLQHTPDPERAFRSLPRYAKPGGSIAIDVYRKRGWLGWLKSYRRVRWITRSWKPERLEKACRIYINLIWWFIKPLWKLPRMPFKPLQQLAGTLFLVRDQFWRRGHAVSDQFQKDWAVLQLFDLLGAYYDLPQTEETVQAWLVSEGLTDVEVVRGGQGVLGRAATSGR